MAWPALISRTKNWGNEVLTDADLEGQFDLINTYINDMMNSSTGHKHDGTTAEGPKIADGGLDLSAITQLYSTTKAINEAKGSDIASATTTDIGAATGNFVDVTGTTTITGLGTVQAGTRRIVQFDGALTLTYNATSLILPGNANITTAAGDVATFVSLGSGNWICTNYQRDSNDPTVAGKIVQVVNTQTGAAASGTTLMVSDDTIPQNTEGDEYMTLAITPQNTNNKLKIDVVAQFAHSLGNPLSAALFQDSTANAIASMYGINTPNNNIDGMIMTFTHYMTAGTTSSTTFKLRAGNDTGGTTYFNGDSSGRKFGGTIASSITITEISA